MALMVKSRRARSSARLRVKATWSGWRWSVYCPSRRKVVTSTGRPSERTVTVPCFSPVGTHRREAQADRISSGRAEVAAS